MNKKFEEIRTAARCREIEEDAIQALLDLVDRMAEELDMAKDKIMDFDIREKNPEAAQVLENNLTILEDAVAEFGNLILNK